MKWVISAIVIVFVGATVVAFRTLERGNAIAFTFAAVCALFFAVLPTAMGALSRRKKERAARDRADATVIRSQESNSAPESSQSRRREPN